MTKYFIAFLMLGCPVLGRAQCVVTTIGGLQTAINSAAANTCALPNRNTVNIAAGSYTVASPLTVTCPGAAGMIIQGPTPAGVGTTWPITPTAILNSSMTNQWAFNGAACANGTTFQYLEVNGNDPSSGGGFLYVPAGMNHLTVQYNFLHGVSGAQVASNRSDSLIWLDGSNIIGSTRTTNTTIQWNRLGTPDSNDCAGLMNVIGGPNKCVVTVNGGGYNLGGTGQCWYQDGDTEKSAGGYCAGVGVHVNVDNFTMSNNTFAHLEQGAKFFEGCEGPPYPCTNQYKPTNLNIVNNDFMQIHRIIIEAQMGGPGPWNINGNSMHDMALFSGVSWGWSLPQAGGASINNANNMQVKSNLLLENLPHGVDKYGQQGFRAFAIEYWDVNGSVANNLIQGYWGGGISWGCGGPGTWNIVNNNLQQLSNYFQVYIEMEEPQCTTSPSPISGNATTHTISVVTSTKPTITPVPTGTYSTPIAVTITDAGIVSGGTLPLGNTSIYYTLDGSTPTTASTWCKSPCSLPSVAPGTTVSAIGMWGDLNQPRSYASGFGYIPSAVAANLYSAGSTPTLTGVTVSLTGGGSSVQVSKSVQACANTAYTGGNTGQVCGAGTDTFGTTIGTWTSSTSNASITTGALVSGVTAGTSNLTVKATQGATNFTSPNFALTIAPLTQSLTGLSITCPVTLQVGQSGNCTALCSYTGPQQTNCTATDQFGNIASGWASSVPAFATVSGPAVTAVAVGTTQISASAGGFPSSVAVQITSATPPPATLTGVTVSCGAGSVTVGSTINCTSQCAYSDSTFTSCNTTDSHGNTAHAWTSSVTADATINATTGVLTGVAIGSTNVGATAGAFTSTAVVVPVTAAPGITILGNIAFDTVASTYPNATNSTYAVTDAIQHNVQGCTFYLPSGSTYTAGSKWDCGLILAPTATTQATSWLCWNTYTTSGTSTDYGWHTVNLSTCGTLPAHTAYWVGVNTNEAGPITEGFSKCSGSPCTGSAPTSGNGTYPCAYASATHGIYTGMATTMTLGCGTAGVQASQYATLTTPAPSLTGGYLSNPGNTVILSINGAVQFYAFCTYSDSSVNQCFPTPDQYGNTVTSWTSSAPTVVKINNIGSAIPGLAQGLVAGTANVQAILTGGLFTRTWGLIVSGTPAGYPPSTVKVLSR